jgi:RNA polymerase sigma factor (sigma-70 family)
MIDTSKHLGLVASIAQRYTSIRPIEDTDEYGWGIDGLMHAARKFEPERNLQFSTYATWCIRGYILRKKKKRKRNLTFTKYTDHIPAKKDSARDAMFLVQDILDNSPVENERHMLNRNIVISYYFKDMTLGQLGEMYGLSKERIRQRRDEELKRMKVCAEGSAA